MMSCSLRVEVHALWVQRSELLYPVALSIGCYLKHLIMYHDGKFAKHPRLRYIALNTDMQWRALQAGRVYIQQHPEDARLSVDELCDMVGAHPPS